MFRPCRWWWWWVERNKKKRGRVELYILLLFICLIIFQSLVEWAVESRPWRVCLPLPCFVANSIVSTARWVMDSFKERERGRSKQWKHTKLCSANETKMMRTHGWVTYHDPHHHPARTSSPSQSSATAQKGRLNEWTENWWLVWIVRGWYGDFYNLFTNFRSLDVFPKHSFIFHPVVVSIPLTSLFSIKSSGIYWMMMIHYIFFPSPSPPRNWKKNLEDDEQKEAKDDREVNKNVCDRMWLSRKKMIRVILWENCAWLFNYRHDSTLTAARCWACERLVRSFIGDIVGLFVWYLD